MRIVVVGAGIFGVAAAIELRARGHEVELVDRGPVPRLDAASTDISKAVRMDYGTDVLYVELMEEALARWRAQNRISARPLFHESGFLLLASRPFAEGGFEADSFALLEARGHALERLDEAAIAKRYPRFRAGRFVDGYLNPQGGWAESGEVLRELIERARSEGVALVEDVGDARVIERGGAVTGVSTASGRHIEADCVVVAAGTWTSRLLPELAGALRTVAQPIVHFDPVRADDFAPPHHVTWGADIARTGWYGFPTSRDGWVKVANHGPGVACSPDVPREEGVEHLERFRAFARDVLPDLADARCARQRVCLYCDTADGDFLIDRHPERPGVVVASGGSGHGFKFAPILGELIADVVEDAPNRYRERFRWRDPGATGRREAARFGGDPGG